MRFSKLSENKIYYDNTLKDKSKNLYKGACVKIKNSKKIFQVVGINPKNKVCWIREWPFDLEAKKTFSLGINEITVKTLCTNRNYDN